MCDVGVMYYDLKYVGMLEDIMLHSDYCMAC